MNIAITGSGNVGGALAQSLIRARHKVLIGARFPLSEKSKKLAAITGEECFAPVDIAAKQSDVIIITTPPESVTEIILLLGDVSGKTIIDATNSIRTKPKDHATAFHAIKALTGLEQVVKCFNTTGFENMLNPIYNGQGIDMFCAGNDKNAKETARRLALDIGFGACHDFGGDDKVELLEKLALSWINLAIMQGQGRNIAFSIIKR